MTNKITPTSPASSPYPPSPTTPRLQTDATVWHRQSEVDGRGRQRQEALPAAQERRRLDAAGPQRRDQSHRRRRRRPDEFYKLHHGSQIFAHSAAGEAWKLINDSGAAAVVAAGIYLYSWHQDGTIWRYSGTPGVWEQLDTHPETVGVVGNKDGKVWQLRRHRNSRARFLSYERRS